MSKKDYRVRNWPKYNDSLIKRGSITLWFSKECTEQWENTDRTGKRGRPKKYNDIVIECGLTLKALFSLTFRSTEGFIQSLIDIFGLNLAIPDYTLLCKRQKNLSINFKKPGKKIGEVNIVVDTTGVTVYGEGEWKVRQHGWAKHRLWRKLHLAVNEKTQEIEGFALTDLGKQDCEGLPMLLNQIESKVGSCKADGAYDRFSCYEESEQRSFRLIVPPQRNAVTSDERHGNKKKASENAVKKRDEAVQAARQLGRKEWKIQSGYHKRSLAETAMFRVKTLLGNRLTSKKFENQQIEAAIWCKIINQMTNLGMPISSAVD